MVKIRFSLKELAVQFYKLGNKLLIKIKRKNLIAKLK